MNKLLLLALTLLILSLLLSACGPSTGEVLPIKFEYTSGDGLAAISHFPSGASLFEVPGRMPTAVIPVA